MFLTRTFITANVVPYTTSAAHPTSTRPPGMDKNATAGAIAGGVIGGVACLSIIGMVYWLYFHRRRYRRRPVDLLGPADSPPVPPDGDHDKQSYLPTNLPSAPPQVHAMASPSEPIPPASVGSPSSCIPELENEPGPPSHLRVVNPGPRSVSLLRSARQVELQKHMATLRKEIGELTADIKWAKTASSGGGDNHLQPGEISSPNFIFSGKIPRRQKTPEPELRAQIQMLAEQVAFLQAQQSSPRAQGLSGESPPDYSPGNMSLSNLPPVTDTNPK